MSTEVDNQSLTNSSSPIERQVQGEGQGVGGFPPAGQQGVEAVIGMGQERQLGATSIGELNRFVLPDSPHSSLSSPSHFTWLMEIEGDENLGVEKSSLPASSDPGLSKLVTGSDHKLTGSLSDIHEWTEVEHMTFVPSVGNKIFTKKKIHLHEY